MLQLCVSDGVEDLMEGMSLTVDTEKSPSSQGPEGQLSGAGDGLLGETGGAQEEPGGISFMEVLDGDSEPALTRVCGPQTRGARRAPGLVRTWPRVQV